MGVTKPIEDMCITSVRPFSRLSYWQFKQLKRCILSRLFPHNTTFVTNLVGSKTSAAVMAGFESQIFAIGGV